VTLASLFAAHDVRQEDVAAAAGVDPRLFDRIDAGLQPIPADVAASVALSLSVSPAEVYREAGEWTLDVSAASKRPVPVDPDLYGGRVDYAPLSPLSTAPIVPPPAPPSGWVVYDRAVNDSVLVRFHRDSGALLSATPLSGVLIGARSVLDLAAGGGELFAVASAGNGAAYRVDAKTAAVEARSALSYAGARAIEHEPVTGTLWVADTAAERLRRLRLDDMEPAASLTLTDSGTDYDPADLVALGGYLYVLATDPSGDAFVWQVDPVTDSVVAQSGLLPDAACLAASTAEQTGAPFLWVVTSTSIVHRLDPTTLAGGNASIPGAPLENPSAVVFFSSRLWVSERTVVGDDPKWSAVELAGFTVTATQTYPASPVTGLGRMATDGVFAWAPHAGSLLVPDGLERLNPNDYASVLSARPASPADAARVPSAMLFL
jgi:hypothetical protein